MKQLRDALSRAVRDAYRRRGRFAFAVEPDYPSLVDYFRQALGDNVARRLVKSYYVGLLLEIKGKMTPAQWERLLAHRQDLLRGSKEALLSMGDTALRPWESSTSRKDCVAEAKRLFRDFARAHGGQRAKGGRYRFTLGRASLVLILDFGTYRGNLDVDMLVPELSLRIPCGMAFCIRHEDFLSYADRARFSHNVRCLLRLIAAFLEQVRSDCAAGEACAKQETNPGVVRKK